MSRPAPGILSVIPMRALHRRHCDLPEQQEGRGWRRSAWPVRACSSMRRSTIVSPVAKSRFPVGSSASSNGGPTISARAMATRCVKRPCTVRRRFRIPPTDGKYGDAIHLVVNRLGDRPHLSAGAERREIDPDLGAGSGTACKVSPDWVSVTPFRLTTPTATVPRRVTHPQPPLPKHRRSPRSRFPACGR